MKLTAEIKEQPVDYLTARQQSAAAAPDPADAG